MRSLKCFIAEQLEKTEIFEMARSLSNYKDDIENILRPLLAHCILVKLAHKENSTEFVDHWKHEIKGFLIRFVSTRLKTSNSYDSKLRYVKNVILDRDELDDEEVFIRYIQHKLFDEGYDLDENYVRQQVLPIVEDFIINDLDNLIDLIADQNSSRISDWVKNL